MSNKIINIILSIFIFELVYSSCTANCEDVPVSKVEWRTIYEDYYTYKDTIIEYSEYVDTLVSYSIQYQWTKMDYKKDRDGNLKGSTCTRYFTIKNNNSTYSNRFAIKLTGKEYNESSSKWNDLNKSTDYVYIGPNDTYTFSISHSAWWRNDASGYNENNVSITVLQQSNYVSVQRRKLSTKRVKQTRRIDSLEFKDTILNTCDCDVEAFIERNRAIQETFEKLKKEHLIYTK